MEPGFKPSEVEYAAAQWNPLMSLVLDADSYGHKLTLLFSPQFARWVCQDTTRVSIVKSWQNRGHEVGVHHHGPHMGTWDGYADSANYATDPEYQGTLADMVGEVKKLTRDGKIRTATISFPEDAQAEWPAGVPFEADGGFGGLDDLVSEPQSVVRGGHSVMSIRHAQYGTGIHDVSLSQLEVAAANLADGQVMGLAFHDRNYASNPVLYQELFRLLKEWAVPVRTVRSVLERH
jgi:hypothetical protein